MLIFEDISLCSGRDNLKMVQFLLLRNADPNANTDGNNTALEKAAATGSIPILKALLEAGAVMKGRSTLVKAAYYGRTDVINYLLDNGAMIDEVPLNETIVENQRELESRNPLSTAAWRGQIEALRLLLQRGADRDLRDAYGKTALDLAQEEHHWNCISLLASF